MITTLHREFSQHRWAYIFLVVVMIIATLMFMAVWPSRTGQRLVGVGVALFYLSWGLFTHWRAKHISRHVIYEYVAVALLGGLLLFMVTL